MRPKIVLIRRIAPGTPIATIVTTLVMLTGIDVLLGGGALLATAGTSLGPAVPHPSASGALLAAGVVLAGAVGAYLLRRKLSGVLSTSARPARCSRTPAASRARP